VLDIETVLSINFFFFISWARIYH